LTYQGIETSNRKAEFEKETFAVFVVQVFVEFAGPALPALMRRVRKIRFALVRRLPKERRYFSGYGLRRMRAAAGYRWHLRNLPRGQAAFSRIKGMGGF
jgi:hypothetical protein